MFRRQFWRLPTALWRLKRSWHDYAHAMAGFDAVLTPVLGHTTPALGHLSPDVPFDTLFERLREYVSFTPLANATGAPAISLWKPPIPGRCFAISAGTILAVRNKTPGTH